MTDAGWLPAEHGETEGGLGEEHVGADRLEGGAGRIRRALVVAAHDPDLAVRLDAELRRPEHVPRGMERELDLAHGAPFAVLPGLDGRAGQAVPGDRETGRGAEIRRAALAGMVGVGVGEHRARDRRPRVDVESAPGAVQPLRAHGEQVGHAGVARVLPRCGAGAHGAPHTRSGEFDDDEEQPEEAPRPEAEQSLGRGPVEEDAGGGEGGDDHQREDEPGERVPLPRAGHQAADAGESEHEVRAPGEG